MQKTIHIVAAGFLCALMVHACAPVPALKTGDALQGEITISGAFALYPLMTRWAEEFQRIYPDVRFDIGSGGAGKGMSDVLAGMVDIGMVSREITAEEENRNAYAIPVAKDAVFVLVNETNPVVNDLLSSGISQETLTKIFILGEITNWGEVVNRPDVTQEIHVYTRNDICGAAATWSLYLGGIQDDLLGAGKFGDPGMVQAVKDDQLGIGYNNLIYAYGLGDVPPQGTVILPLDVNDNGQADLGEILDTRGKAVDAVESGQYPAPPSRTLYLVTNGKPQGVLLVFLTWVLTDGQQFVDRSGYVLLPPEQLDSSIQKIR